LRGGPFDRAWRTTEKERAPPGRRARQRNRAPSSAVQQEGLVRGATRPRRVFCRRFCDVAMAPGRQRETTTQTGVGGDRRRRPPSGLHARGGGNPRVRVKERPIRPRRAFATARHSPELEKTVAQGTDGGRLGVPGESGTLARKTRGQAGAANSGTSSVGLRRHR